MMTDGGGGGLAGGGPLAWIDLGDFRQPVVKAGNHP